MRECIEILGQSVVAAGVFVGIGRLCVRLVLGR